MAAGSLNIRDVDDVLITRLERRAARHRRSAEAEMRDILRQALEGEADGGFERVAADLRKLTATRTQMPAEVLQGEGRDER